MRFEVAFDGGPSGEGVPESSADPALWDLLFTDGMRVGPSVFQDHAKRNIHTISVRPLLTFLQATYGAAAAEGTNLPSLDDPFGPLAPFGALVMISNRVTDSQSFFQELARAKQKNKPDGTVVFEPVAGPAVGTGDAGRGECDVPCVSLLSPTRQPTTRPGRRFG